MSDWTSCPCCDGDGGMTSGSYPDHEVRGGQYLAPAAPLDDDDDGWQERGNPGEDATPAPLDVERLARAVSHARTTIDGGGVYTGTGRWVPAADFAAAIAAAYAEEDGNAPSR